MAAFAVGFDFDHTLCFDHQLERTAFVRLIGAIVEDGGHAPHGNDVAAMADAALSKARSGAISIDGAVREFAAPLLVDGQEPDTYVAIFKDLVLDMADDFVKPAPGALALLDQLHREGIPTAILTNGWTPLQQKKAAVIGYSGRMIVSDQIGVQKPDPRAFERLVQFFELAPADIWYVGDNPGVDIAGALGAGLRAVWLDDGTYQYPPGLAPVQRIHALTELLEIFERSA